MRGVLLLLMLFFSVSGVQGLEMTGVLEIIQIDDFNNPRLVYMLSTESEKFEIIPPSMDKALLSGMVVKVTIPNSVASSEALYVSDLEIIESNTASALLNSHLGSQRTLVLLVNFQDDHSEPFSKEQIYNIIFSPSNAASIANYFTENSYGRTFLNGSMEDIYGWYTIDLNKAQACQLYNTAFTMARALADNEVDFTDYKRVIIIFPPVPCGWSGIATVGSINYNLPDGVVPLSISWINGMGGVDFTIAHELGHNFVLFHSNGWECGATTIGNCFSAEYQDLFDVMGKSESRTHFNAYHKKKLSWIDQIQIIENPITGIYRLTPLETNYGTKALRLNITDGNYFLEYRRPIGFDQYTFNNQGYFVKEGIYNGTFMRLYKDLPTGETHLLDFNPNVSLSHEMDYLNVVLRKNKTFSDRRNNITIRTIDYNETGLEVFVSTSCLKGELICDSCLTIGEISNYLMNLDSNAGQVVNDYYEGRWCFD